MTFPKPTPRVIVTATLVTGGVTVTLASFALTWHGINGFGLHVMHLGNLAAVGPVAIDGATAFAIAATFLLSHVRAPRSAQAVAWGVFALTITESVVLNALYASGLTLPREVSMCAAALWPVTAASVAHLGVICWRYRPAQSATPARQPAERTRAARSGAPRYKQVTPKDRDGTGPLRPTEQVAVADLWRAGTREASAILTKLEIPATPANKRRIYRHLEKLQANGKAHS